MPPALCRLFATVLIFYQPSDPTAMWLKYYAAISQDYRHHFPSSKNLVKQLTDIIDALDAPIPQECISCRDRLNPTQQQAFDCIIDHVIRGEPCAFFIDGPGGTGETFLYNALYAEVCLMKKIVLPTATSGITASNIPSGRTAHSRFKILVDSESSLACDVPKQGSLAALIKETTLIIWDEASMEKKENVESLDLLLRDLCNPDALFGGKLVVFGGDTHMLSNKQYPRQKRGID
ncbi:uncharacterized protein [Spinacia oleracea]|uniref:ATP-dependent DNA helicase n=1 Tax=Spinacia oleracea TaxID=3562 RepID=A0ABM3RJG4_SPIOL|nr:uncharacterized protein LOC110795519 [Spinacia oleracea]